jgi:hypothetical protein
MIKDIEGNILAVGDYVYYARKADFCANGELVKCRITSIKNGDVKMGKYTSTNPSNQLIKIRW